MDNASPDKTSQNNKYKTAGAAKIDQCCSRLTSALYRVTELFPAAEPLKPLLRQKANEILAGFNSLSSEKPAHLTKRAQKRMAGQIIREIGAMAVFLELARRQNWVKELNFLVLKREYNKLGEELQERFFKKREITSPVICLFLGLLITAGFLFLPFFYDPLIIRVLPETAESAGYMELMERGRQSSDLYDLTQTSQNNTTRKPLTAKTNTLIRITWFSFVVCFLLPIAVMVPLHWYERRKHRRKKRKIPGSPKVSLIFPAYNEEKFIAKTIEQGLKQDYRGEIELVIVDDGSTDKTCEIAESYCVRFPNVKLYRHTRNSGKSAALNTGFKKASGQISIFSDTDSHLAADLTNRMVPHFDDPKIGLVSAMIVVDNEINLLTKLQQIEYLYNQELIRFCQATHKSVLICPGAATAVRTEIARDIPSTERTITEDADFTFEVARAGWKVSQEPEAISWTDVPETWRDLIKQRKRWLYGVLQTVWIHKWALFYRGTKIPNLWVWWAWLGYITCPITPLVVIVMPVLAWLIGPAYLIFLFFYSIVVVTLYVFAHWYGIKQYSHSSKIKLFWLLPAYMVYQYLLNVLLFYLVIAFITRKGITVRYGGRDIRAV